MITAATRQDLQNALERTRMAIVGTMFSRNDARTAAAQLRTGIAQDLHELLAANQQTAHQSQAQYEQLLSRISSLEQRMYSLQQILTRYIETQSRNNPGYYR